MSTRKRFAGIPVHEIRPCDSGFGEWEKTGSVVYIPRDNLTVRMDIDGLIREQNGMIPVEGVDSLHGETVGMTRHLPNPKKLLPAAGVAPGQG